MKLRNMSPGPMQAQPPIQTIAPRFKIWFWQVCRLVLPLWIKLTTPIAKFQTYNVETLVQLYQQFQAGQIRLILAIRHPSFLDGYSFNYLLSHLMPRLASQQKIRLSPPFYAHFVYEHGLLIWAGRWVGRILSWLGCIPIHRGTFNWREIRAIQDLLVNSYMPVAIAPEGTISPFNESIQFVKPGIGILGFKSLQDLRQAGRQEDILIVPLNVQYRFLHTPWQTISRMLTQLEADWHLQVPKTQSTEATFEHLYSRLLRLGEHCATQMEQFYQSTYHCQFPSVEAQTPEATLDLRLKTLLDTAIALVEQHFGVVNHGTIRDRILRLEYAAFKQIYREELRHPQKVLPTTRGLLNRQAAEASQQLWHLRLVEIFSSVQADYIRERPNPERFADILLLFWYLTVRLKGDWRYKFPKIDDLEVVLSVGEPLSVSQRWSDYQNNRTQAIKTLIQDIKSSLEGLII